VKHKYLALLLNIPVESLGSLFLMDLYLGHSIVDTENEDKD